MSRGTARTRIAKELVGNVAAHAGGDAWVHLDWSDEVPRIDIQDDGPGFIPPAQPSRTGGLADVARLAGPIEASFWKRVAGLYGRSS